MSQVAGNLVPWGPLGGATLSPGLSREAVGLQQLLGSIEPIGSKWAGPTSPRQGCRLTELSLPEEGSSTQISETGLRNRKESSCCHSPTPQDHTVQQNKR